MFSIDFDKFCATAVMEVPNISITLIKVRFGSLMARAVSFQNITFSLASFINNLSLRSTKLTF